MFPLQATAASLKDASYFKQVGFKFMLRQSMDTIFFNISVYDYLWNYKSDLIQNIQTLAPFLVPTDNSGVLHTV